jgi:RimJ/RimL family protein N-acetyltransferase
MGRWRDIELDQLELRTDRLLLRPWRAEDAGAVFVGVRDRSMQEYTSLPSPYRAEDAREFVGDIASRSRRAGDGFEAALVDHRGDVVGAAALRLPAREVGATTAEIGYLVYPAAQGNGYAAEATWALTEWALARGIHRVGLRCAVGNLASAKTALRAGLRFEGVERGGVRAGHGEIYDAAVFGRRPSDPDRAIPAVFAPLPAGGLTDGVVVLRAVLPGDAPAISAEQNDPLALAWSFTGQPVSEQAVRAGAERAGLDWLVGSAAPFSIVDVDTGELAGSLRLRLAGPPGVGGIGYGLRPEFRGRALTARALRLLVGWAFTEGGFTRLELGAKSANIASQKAALAAGFLPDGVRAARLRNPDGSFSDEVRFALVDPAAVRTP